MPRDSLDLDGDGILDEPIPFDASGRRRIFSATGVPRVDIGAYEANAPVGVRERPWRMP